MKGKEFEENLERGLKERHIQLIALGGAIGVGLFLGSATAIKTAGPALLLSYIIGGLFILFIMRSLGELAVAYPVSGSFSAYANKFIGPLAGYITGWTYWFMWVVTCMAEITAVGVYVQFWFPDVPQWIPAMLALVAMTIVNVVAVSAFGEFEFWFAMIKIITILVMIVVGAMMIFFGLGNDGIPTGLTNLVTNGGFMPMGVEGVVMSLVMVMFAYLGIELVGVAAGEASNPEKTIPAAIDKVFWRILVFYVGALIVIMSLYPWNQLGTIGSPFVFTFKKLGIAAAAGIINFVVLTAALLHDTLFFDFVYEVVREKMILGSDELTDADIRIFFKNKQEQSEKVASLQDYTLHRLGSCYKTQLYEAGILESNQANSTRKILKPILDIAFEHWLYDHDLGIMVKTLTGVR